jgi:hypothetical protein
MEAGTILGVYAQLAVVIVGLSGIVAVAGSRATGNWQIADHYRFWTMMASGFTLLFQSIFPLILHHFSPTSQSIWAWSSAAAALLVSGTLYWRWRGFERAQEDPKFRMSVGLFNNALLASAAVILILNTVGLVFQGTFAAYLLAMSLVLANSFAVFVRLLVVALPRT